ncbi:unnamed protein product [Clavelina lepadiformis]|uniref:BHLH domain-containing protein n=1 Tax=Clavelina lepadiformis TaxID=159417 RepID=A0ABP0GUG1_CLALP
MLKGKSCFVSTSAECNIGRQKRRASQAKHRQNIAACFKNLRSVLPDGHPENMQQFRRKPDILQHAFSGVRCNKTTTLKRARDYVLHLESVVEMLIAEKQVQFINQKSCLPSSYARSTSSSNQDFESLLDVQRNFKRNFEVCKPISEYDFECQPSPEPNAILLKHVINQINQTLYGKNIIAQGQSTSNVTVSNADTCHTFAPVKMQALNDIPVDPMIVEVSSFSRSPSANSIDLGFVSAENASQDTAGSIISEQLPQCTID